MKCEIHSIFTRLFKRATFASCWLVLITSLTWQHSHPAFAQTKPQILPAPAPKRIVLLYSYGDGIPAYQQATRAFLSVMKEGGVSVNHLFLEYLDLERNKDKEHKKNLVTLLRHKYANEKIELIVTVHTPALRFLLNEGRSLFPKTRVLCYLAPNIIETAGMEQQFVLLPMRMDFRGTLELAQRLFPQTKRVVLISGVGEGDKRLEGEAKSVFEKWRDKLEFEYTSQLSLEEMLQRIATLPPRTIVIYSNLFTDKTGRTFVARDVAEMVAKAANAPVFGMYNTILGSGIIGGSVFDFEEEGARAGRMALEIVRGKLSLTEPVTVLTASRTPMFDWQQLKRWGVNEIELPRETIFVNRSLSFWDKYKTYVIGIAAFVLAQSILIVVLLLQIRSRKKAEESLRQKTGELNRFFDVNLDLLCIANIDGYFVRLNPAWESILGHSREELMAKRFLDFVHPDDLDRTREAISALASQQKVFSFGNRYRCKDGTYRWIEWNSASTGNLIYAAARDVTDRKRAEEALEERLRFEQLLSNVSSRFVNIPAGQVDSEVEDGLKQMLEFFQVDRCGLIQVWPAKAAWMVTHVALAYDIPSPPVGVELSISIVPWVNDKLIHKGESIAVSRLDDLPPEANRDKRTWIEWGVQSGMYIPIKASESSSYVIAIDSMTRECVWPKEVIPRLRMLGEILVNALERKRAQAEIAASELRYRTVADYTYDWEYWSAPDGTLNYISPSCERISGYSVREFMDDPSLFLKMIVPEDREAWDRHDHDARGRGESRGIQFRIRTKAGEIRWIEHVCLPVRDAQGKSQGIRASNRDISDRKKAEFEAQKQRNELAHVTRVAALGELTSSIAHELNQPLAAIRNYANAAQRFLSQGEPDLSKTREALEGIIRDDRRAAEVISRVRGLLKKEEPRYRPVDMNSVIQESLAFIHNDSVIKGLSIETELAPAVPVVLGDRVQLQQVLLNLILNAVDAMNKAKPDLSKLVIKTENEGDQGVKVSVRDFGTGIDEAQNDKLFEPFYTTKPAGMGMGLAISARIIHAHGGSIWAENNPDEGATFYFTLPTGNRDAENWR